MQIFSLSSIDSQKLGTQLDSCSEGGLNLISKNNNNSSNINRNRTTSNNSSNYSINNNEPSDLDDGKVTIKNERIDRSSSRSRCETDEKQGNDTEKTDEDFEETDNENDNNNNEDDEREDGEIKDDESTEKTKTYKKKKRRRRKRELTLKTDQSQQIEDDDDETGIKSSPPYDKDHERRPSDENIDGDMSDSYLSNNNVIRKNSYTRRRNSSSSDPVNLSIGKQHHQDDSDDANIDVETISNAPTKVSLKLNILIKFAKNSI